MGDGRWRFGVGECVTEPLYLPSLPPSSSQLIIIIEDSISIPRYLRYPRYMKHTTITPPPTDRMEERGMGREGKRGEGKGREGRRGIVALAIYSDSYSGVGRYIRSTSYRTR